MVWLFVEYIVNCTELYVYHEFSYRILGQKDNYKIYLHIFVLLLFASLITFINHLGESMPFFSQFGFVIFYIFYICMALFFYKGKNIIKALITLIYFAILLSSEVLTILSLDVFGNISMEEISSQSAGRIISMIMAKLLSFYIVKIMQTFKFYSVVLLKKAIIITYSFIIIADTLIGTSLIHYMEYLGDNHENDYLSVISSLGLLVINFLIYFLTDYLIKSSENEKTLMLMAKQTEHYKTYIKDIELANDSFNKLRHDYKSDILYLKNILSGYKNNDVKDFFEKILSKVEASSYVKYSCPIAVNAVVNSKKHKAESHNIAIEIEILIPKELSISHYDLCNVLGNALDNSIEACERLIDKSINKYINFTMYTKDKYIYICIENPFDHEIKYNNNKVITSKQNKQLHGLGLRIMQEIVEKYDGYICIDSQKGKFEFLAALKI